ncbi:formyltransferase family protein, partial [Sedimentibacter sp.]
VHFVDEGADTGPIIFQEAVKVSDSDTAETLQKRVLVLEHRLLPLAVKMYCEDRLYSEGRRVVIR